MGNVPTQVRELDLLGLVESRKQAFHSAQRTERGACSGRPNSRLFEVRGSLHRFQACLVLTQSTLLLNGQYFSFCCILTPQIGQTPLVRWRRSKPVTQRQGGSGVHGQVDTKPCVWSVYYRLVRNSLVRPDTTSYSILRLERAAVRGLAGICRFSPR